MVNSNKIKGRMKELRLTQADVAKRLGIAPPTVSQKINNVRSFDIDQAGELAAILGIKPYEFGEYFFVR